MGIDQEIDYKESSRACSSQCLLSVRGAQLSECHVACASGPLVMIGECHLSRGCVGAILTCVESPICTENMGEIYGKGVRVLSRVSVQNGGKCTNGSRKLGPHYLKRRSIL